MPKSHRASQQWEHWLSQTFGNHVLEAERQFLPPLLADCYGKHSLLIGVPHQHSLLKYSAIQHQVLLTPLLSKKNNGLQLVESEFNELPFASGSIDLVLLPHTLEYLDNPRKLLAEACRVVKPEGYLIVFGFNPYSLWGLKKKLMKNHTTPWKNNFIPARHIKKWLTLADFELVKQDTLLFRPPLPHHETLFQKLKIMEWMGHKLWSPFGGVYMLMAQAKVIPLTPIKLHWKQLPSGVNVTIPGPSVRVRNL